MTGDSGKDARAAYADALRTWPGVQVSEQRFADFLRACSVDSDIGALCTADILLALGCLDRDPRALELFESNVMKAVRPSVERACRNAEISVDDVMQGCREALVLGRGNGAPKLAGYRGLGSLLVWVRVVAVREALQERRRSRRTSVVDPVELLQETTSTSNDEVEYLRRRYGTLLREAVNEGLARLAPEQRLLLKLYTHDGLSIDQLAPLLGVHRATAARRLERARADCLSFTRAALRERHGFTESEARSLCIALGSELDMSLGRALAAGGE